jgi:hypothetical protein
MDVVRKVWRVISRSDSRVAVAWIRNRRAISSDRSNLPGSDRGAVHFSAAGSQWSPRLSALPFFGSVRSRRAGKCHLRTFCFNPRDLACNKNKMGNRAAPHHDTLLLLWRRRKDTARSTHRVRGVI